MKAPEGTHCFRVVRTDSSGNRFLLSALYHPAAAAPKTGGKHAFRRAVQVDLWREREAFFKAHVGPDGLVACGVTGERITRDAGHMDHHPPMTFEVIVTTFLGGKGMSLEDVPLTVGQDEQTAPDVTNPALSEEFRAYHNKLAKIEFVKSTINLAQASRNRIRPTRITLKTPGSLR
jgi:hypothetical protein